MCLFVHGWVCACECTVSRIQKRAADSLEVVFQEFVSHSTWVLVAELGSSGRTEINLNTELSHQT